MREYDRSWNFEEYSMKAHIHGIHDYPAMMMPMIANRILNKYGKKEETVVLDPFMGSGTTLVEAQLYGAKRVIGYDLNPLAVLISKGKVTKYDIGEIENSINDFMEFNYRGDKNLKTRVEFSILYSWYYEYVIDELSRIKYFIDNEIVNEGVRQFFKITFSTVARNVSETRIGEFKIYRMSQKQLEDFNPQPIKEFINLLIKNLEIVKEYDSMCDFKTNIDIRFENSMNILKDEDLKESVDLVLTSPPYGDSRTTVAYGQFSRFSNEWLEFEKPNQVDNNLLGGRAKYEDYTFDIKILDDKINEIRELDKNFTTERYKDVIAFYVDYEKSIKAVAQTVKNGGHVVYVVGNRRVRNVELPTDLITIEMFKKYGIFHEKTYIRDILNKRMPSKASPSNRKGGQISTMMYEYIVVMKKKMEE